jgi:AraC-like DNA-binding protein
MPSICLCSRWNFLRIICRSRRWHLTDSDFKILALYNRGVIGAKKVAERCGFSSVSSFHRNFRQTTGESPAAWRRSRRPGA